MRWFLKLSLLEKFLTGVSILLSFLLGYYALASKLTVSSVSEASEPFDCLLVIKNDSVYSLKSLTVSYGIIKVLFISGASYDNIEMSKTTQFTELEANEATTIRVAKPPIGVFEYSGKPSEIDKAEVFVQITYRPTIFPFESHFAAKFILKKLPSGNFVWIPIAKSILSK